MTIPSPRKFIEITAAFLFMLWFLAGFIVVVFLMVAFSACEVVVDRVRGTTRRRAP